MSTYPGGYAGLLVVALSTHALIGYTLGLVLFDRPRAGVVGALAADVDLLFPTAFGWPFVHRGVTHTLLVGAVATGIAFRLGRGTGASFGVGYASQLLVDTTTPKGVPYLYPIVEESFHVDLGTTGHSPLPTLVLWVCCLALLWRRYGTGTVAPTSAQRE